MGRLVTAWMAIAAYGALTACAARPVTATRPQNASDARADEAEPTHEAERRPKGRARFEASWADYYKYVMQRAWSYGGTVIWIAPPPVKRTRTPEPGPEG